MSDFKLKLALFPVKEKKNENGPDQTGAIEIPAGELGNLVQYLTNAEQDEDWQGNPIVKLSVSTWTNEMKDGRKYLKGTAAAPYKPDAQPAPATPASFDNSEIPF